MSSSLVATYVYNPPDLGMGFWADSGKDGFWSERNNLTMDGAQVSISGQTPQHKPHHDEVYYSLSKSLSEVVGTNLQP